MQLDQQQRPHQQQELDSGTGRRGRLAASLLAATCTLLGSVPGPALAAEESKSWEFDTAVLYYSEKDRVSDGSAHVLAQRALKDGGLLRFKATVDALSGASPNGALPGLDAQTFTSPSGNDSYTTPAGEIPLDPTFHDTRLALSANWVRPLGRMMDLDLGASFSSEFDYTHAGLSAALTRDLKGRNTTLSAAFAFSADSVNPQGGVPRPFSLMPPPGEGEGEGEEEEALLFLGGKDDDGGGGSGSESKTVVDALFGVTHVFGPSSIGQLNYSFSRSSGYLNDPYKILSVLEPGSGAPLPGPEGISTYLYESRPDTRTRHSLFTAYKQQLGRDILDLSYRFMTDDWGIDSHTVDLRYRLRMKRRWYLQPHLRYYTQTAADFYRLYLVDGIGLPMHATADFRLAEFDAFTYGAKIGWRLRPDAEWSVRLEYYTQSGVSPPPAAPGLPAGDALLATLDALIVQFGYRF